MRKGIVFFVILLLLAGVVFFFGWIQFEIPANSYGVVFTKTNGWEPDPVPAGEFTWRWQRLLPTNLTLYVYNVEAQEVQVSSSGTLPSAEVYASAIQSSVDFAYRVEADVQFSIRPESLPQIAQDGVTPTDLSDWYADLQAPIRETIVEAFGSALTGREAGPSVGALADTARSQLENRFPDLEILSVSPRSTEFPDYELYQRAKELYLEGLEAYEEGVAEAERRAALSATQQRSRIELLREYGKILSEYPVLLDYFTMSAERGIDPLQLEALRSAASEAEGQ